MVENLIAGYLAGGKRLVIPELGAFLKKDTGETVFVEFLKKDDGVFAGLIAQSLGIPAADATRQAAQFSAEVRDSLAGRGFFIIPRVGTMRRDSSGGIVLTATAAADIPVPQAVPQNTIPASPAAEPAPVVQPKVVQPAPLQQQFKAEEYRRPTSPEPEAPVTGTPTVTTAAPRPAAVQPRPVEPVPSRMETPQPAPSQVRQSPPVRPAVYGQQDRPETARTSRRPPGNVPQARKKTDMIMIIAVIAALIAIGSMVFGLLVNNDPIVKIQPTSPQTEQTVPAADEVAVPTE